MAKKNVFNLTLSGANELKALFETSGDRIAAAVAVRLKTEGNKLKDTIQTELEEHQKNKRNWLLNQAVQIRVTMNKKSLKVALKAGGYKRVRSDPKYQFNPSNYMWKIEYGAREVRRSTTIKGGGFVYDRRRRRVTARKTTAKRDPRPFIMVAIRQLRQEQMQAVFEAVNQEVKKIEDESNT